MSAPVNVIPRMGHTDYWIDAPEYEVPAGACPWCEYRPCRCEEVQ